jgi:hypothetical protein
MQKTLWSVLLLLVATCSAQVVSPTQIKVAELSALQQQYMGDLQAVAQDIAAHHFEYNFYLSRKLDIDEPQQKRTEQASIRFDRFNGHTVLAITGNYYAAYPASRVSDGQRARTTFLRVAMPLLQAAVPRFQSNAAVEGYALEISHHVIGTVMRVSLERPENLVVYLPQAAAARLVAANDENSRQAALLEGQTLLNGVPLSIWLDGQGPRDLAAAPAGTPAPAIGGSLPRNIAATQGKLLRASMADVEPPKHAQSEPAPIAASRDLSKEALALLQTTNQEILDRVVKEVEPQAHFVAYAPPKFVAFRKGIYLELSFTTLLRQPPGESRYTLAALAFDEHVAHLVRPLLDYFKGDQQFDGISLSTTVRVAGKTPASGSSAQSVEFFLPLGALHCYQAYDCTGQQLLDAGTILINGERVGLDLETAESVPAATGNAVIARRQRR